MNQEIHHCKNISAQSVDFFFQKGTSKAGKKILILGESLAKNGWVESGRAFYTLKNKLVPTGKRLNEELAILGLTLDECAFTEIAKCYIAQNRKILSVCGPLCAEHLLDQMSHFKPKIIISLGVITKDVLKEIFKADLQMGEITEIKKGRKSYSMLPLYHPSPANPFGHGKNLDIIKKNKKTLHDLIS